MLLSGVTIAVVLLLVSIGTLVLPLLGPQGKTLGGTSTPTAHPTTRATASPRNQVLNTPTVSHLVKKWAFQTGGFVSSSPTVANGIVYVGSDDGYLYALDATSGQKKWAFRTGGQVLSSPTVANGVIYVGSDDHNLYALTLSEASP